MLQVHATGNKNSEKNSRYASYSYIIVRFVTDQNERPCDRQHRQPVSALIIIQKKKKDEKKIHPPVATGSHNVARVPAPAPHLRSVRPGTHPLTDSAVKRAVERCDSCDGRGRYPSPLAR